ncbi:rCG21124, partial [Rattus norvegicus]
MLIALPRHCLGTVILPAFLPQLREALTQRGCALCWGIRNRAPVRTRDLVPALSKS